jgi:hypothetical protein
MRIPFLKSLVLGMRPKMNQDLPFVKRAGLEDGSTAGFELLA